MLSINECLAVKASSLLTCHNPWLKECHSSQKRDGKNVRADRQKEGHGRGHDISSQRLWSPAHDLHEQKPIKIPALMREEHPRAQTHQRSY